MAELTPMKKQYNEIKQQHQDCLLVMNAHLCGGFEAGDIVIIRKESFKDGEPIVKRVIATEGQTVDIDFVSGAVYVDGKTWTARSSDGTVLPIGTRVIAERMEGVKLYVKPEPVSSTRQSSMPASPQGTSTARPRFPSPLTT